MDRTAMNELPHCTVHPKHNDSKKMHGVEWQGKKSIGIGNRSVPVVTDPADAILKVTSTCICGSDLHLYLNAMPGMHKGFLLGHEFMGIVDSVGPKVTKVKPGDRVVACFDIGCGECMYCKDGIYSSCDVTNPSRVQEWLYGHRSAGFHGYSDLTGGWEGGQAEYARVPFANLNLLKVPDDVPDEQVIFLSDILPTAWHANEMGEVSKDEIVAIWGAGPVGILAAHCAFHRGAARVILIDNQTYRLEHAKSKIPNVEVLDFSKDDTLKKLAEMVPHGPDVSIEAAGFHYCKSWLHAIEMKVQLETDPADILNEMIYATRKGGRISIVGVYAGFTNHFNIGAFMEKGMTMRGGQTPCQRYWPTLLPKVLDGSLDPTIVITHKLPLEDAARGYHIFNEKIEGCIKVILKPGMAKASA